MTPQDEPPKLTGVVEADETYVGGKVRPRSLAERKAERTDLGRLPKRDNDKVPVMALVQRGGDVRATVVPVVTAANVREVLLTYVDPSARLMTDEAAVYKKIGRPFASHGTVEHGKGEYVRGEAHINSAESFFSRLKRQLYGTHHAVSKRHLHRYVRKSRSSTTRGGLRMGSGSCGRFREGTASGSCISSQSRRSRNPSLGADRSLSAHCP